MNQAFNRDCMEAMKEFPDQFFDLAVVDPPYGISITAHEVRDPSRSQSVHVERERESRTGRPPSAEADHSAVRKIQVGGRHLSRPKATTPSTTKSHQMRHTSPS